MNRPRKPPQRRTQAVLSDTIVIATAPALAYLFAFSFEAGYARAFNIPLQFVSLTLTSFFVAAGSTLLLAIVLLFVAEVATSFVPKTDPILARSLRVLFPMALFSLAYVLAFLGTPLQSTIAGVAITWAIVLFLEFGFPLITQRGKGTYLDKLRAQAEFDAQFRGLLEAFAVRLGGVYLLIVYTGIAIVGAYYAGQSFALRQHRFLVAELDPPMIVLRAYGQNAVLAPFDPVTRIVQPIFLVTDLANPAIQPLRLLSVGPLTTIDIPAGDKHRDFSRKGTGR